MFRLFEHPDQHSQSRIVGHVLQGFRGRRQDDRFGVREEPDELAAMDDRSGGVAAGGTLNGVDAVNSTRYLGVNGMLVARTLDISRTLKAFTCVDPRSHA